MARDYIQLKNTNIQNFNINCYLSIKTNENLLNISKKSICRIKIGNDIGTGFLIKLLIPSIKKPLYGLMTNNHVINSSIIKNNKYFKIYLNQMY